MQLIFACILTLLGPGAGHLYLKEKKRGWFYIAVSLVYLAVFMAHMIHLMREFTKALPLPQNPAQMGIHVQHALSAFPRENEFIIDVYFFIGGVLFIACYADMILIYLKRRGTK